MPLSTEQLERQLSQPCSTLCYFLVSSRPVLLEETRETIFKLVSQKGYANREIWEVTTSLNEDVILQQHQTIDLFHQPFIEFRWYRSFNAELGNKLSRMLQKLKMVLKNRSFVIVISCTQPVQKLQQSKWFKSIVANSQLVTLEASTEASLKSLLYDKLEAHKLALNQEAIDYLLQHTEGNLSALIQVIKILDLIYSSHRSILTRQQIEPILEDQASFELFHLTDAILQGDIDRCQRILEKLETRQAPAPLLLGYLLKLLRTASALHNGIQSKEKLSLLFSKYGVWAKQQPGFMRIANSLTKDHISALFSLAHQIDRRIKGAEQGPVSHLFKQFSLGLMGVHMADNNID